MELSINMINTLEYLKITSEATDIEFGIYVSHFKNITKFNNNYKNDSNKIVAAVLNILQQARR